MDSLKALSFIKELIYDLDTVQYLLDYGRLKETVPIMERVLGNIDHFRANDLGDASSDIFAEKFWDNKLPANASLAQMRIDMHTYALAQEELNRINYRDFVKDIFDWSDENISKIRHELKSPLRKRVEKTFIYSVGIAVGLSLGIASSWLFLTRDWGLKGDFYRGMHFEQHLYSGYKKTINFSNPQEMDSRLPLVRFSAIWQGSLIAPKDGEYTISEISDDGAMVSIDGKLLINDWSDHPANESFKKIFLSKGRHRIVLEYYQNLGEAVLRLYWSVDGGKKRIIPAQYLRY